ncbi:hypothetical protein BAUCODRAFT_231413 [Baudoinia panamericana UAMH 10762]|uniref:Uncharacterized protein n=1 Tax=Baudoinia panamericana (strain UAMH 10762) TaxID=717646 RepID=M2M9T9_BAUPA|nr:uncharacterized protein BAUCODRAFT_231413 [Baudoinia panamericana UAMH 10762]EMC93211.1 hypothetical protein BAUCODRAFT_231413 [Baudoinia panamericana UAMH 10762]
MLLSLMAHSRHFQPGCPSFRPSSEEKPCDALKTDWACINCGQRPGRRRRGLCKSRVMALISAARQ